MSQTLPFLFDPLKIRGYLSLPGRDPFAQMILPMLGQSQDYLAAATEATLHTPSYPENLPEYKDWLHAVAEEWLLHLTTAEHPRTPPDWVKNTRLFFPGGPLFSDLADLSPAAAVFPLDGTGAGTAAQCARLWLSAQKPSNAPGDHRSELEGLEAWMHSHLPEGAVYMVKPPNRGIAGHSWQLAAHLALRALSAGRRQARHALASAWLVTGCVSENDVRPVGIGNKTDLCGSRRLMRPIQPDEPFARMVHSVGTVEDAWSLISQSGFRKQANETWPQAHVLHSFVSGAREPVIAAALLTPEIKSLVLWYTTAFEQAAHDICNILGELMPNLGCELQPIGISDEGHATNSHAKLDLMAVEALLRKELEPVLVRGETVLFNITQGTRLMGLAPHPLAMHYPNLHLIYRDFDEKANDVFESIHYPEGPNVATTRRIKADRSRRPSIRWDELAKKADPKELWNGLLARIAPIGLRSRTTLVPGQGNPSGSQA